MGENRIIESKELIDTQAVLLRLAGELVSIYSCLLVYLPYSSLLVILLSLAKIANFE